MVLLLFSRVFSLIKARTQTTSVPLVLKWHSSGRETLPTSRTVYISFVSRDSILPLGVALACRGTIAMNSFLTIIVVVV